MPELNMISPLLTNMELVKCVSVRGGTSVYIVKSTKSNQSYYLKHICIPESQKQVDALMFTGAAATVEDAQNYYAGTRGLGDTVDVILSRLGIYFAEQD